MEYLLRALKNTAAASATAVLTRTLKPHSALKRTSRSYSGFHISFPPYEDLNMKTLSPSRHKSLRPRTLVCALLAVSSVGGVPAASPVVAQPDVNNAPKAENPANRDRKANRQKRRDAVGANGANGNVLNANGRAVKPTVEERDLAIAELVLGKPLSDEQKAKVREASALRENTLQAAQEKYVSDLAQATGLEIDELRLKMRQAAMTQRGRDAQARDERKLNRRNQNVPAEAPVNAPAEAPDEAAVAAPDEAVVVAPDVPLME